MVDGCQYAGSWCRKDALPNDKYPNKQVLAGLTRSEIELAELPLTSFSKLGEVHGPDPVYLAP